jgi:DegV family protein with EDD domain
MNIGFVTDSTSDLPEELVQMHGIQVVPSILVLEGREYADGIGISREEFYTRLPDFENPPTTAAPSIGDFAATYEALLSCGCEHILSIHAASQLTTIVNVARQAALDFPNRITCVDSGSLSLGLGFQVLAAAEVREEGVQAALTAIDSTRRRLQVSAALDTMEYLKRSGRVPGIVAGLGSLLSIKPMIELTEGEVKVIGTVRTTSQADERILHLLTRGSALERLAILHTNAESRAKRLLNGLMQHARKSIPREVLFVNVTTVIGTHVGPDGIGYATVRKSETP